MLESANLLTRVGLSGKFWLLIMSETTPQSLSARWPRVLVQTLIPGVVAVLFARKGHVLPASIVGAIAGFALVSGLFIPTLFARWERLGQAFGKAIAGAVTWICLVPVFYLVFAPGRLILMLTRKDPMGRAFPTQAPTYWVPRAPVKDVAEYRRQY